MRSWELEANHVNPANGLMGDDDKPNALGKKFPWSVIRWGASSYIPFDAWSLVRWLSPGSAYILFFRSAQLVLHCCVVQDTTIYCKLGTIFHSDTVMFKVLKNTIRACLEKL